MTSEEYAEMRATSMEHALCPVVGDRWQEHFQVLFTVTDVDKTHVTIDWYHGRRVIKTRAEFAAWCQYEHNPGSTWADVWPARAAASRSAGE